MGADAVHVTYKNSLVSSVYLMGEIHEIVLSHVYPSRHNAYQGPGIPHTSGSAFRVSSVRKF